MKPGRRFDIKSLILGVIVGVAVMLSVGAATTGRTKWDYAVVQGMVFGSGSDKQPLLQTVINDHASKGWEFVQAGRSTDQWGFAVMRREKE